jgi:hypothetical protein
MRVLSAVFVFIVCASLIGCTKGNQINGRSLRTANRSVSYIKDRLPVEQRVEFEVSFWSLRDEIRNNADFLDTVGGKTPEELIVLGKELFQKRKNAGYKDYEQFASWEQMIAQYTQERIDQNRRKKPDSRDKNNSVLYKL